MKILIIGAGAGGVTAAADLLSQGFDVSVYELPEFQQNLFTMIKAGKIKVIGERNFISPIPDIKNTIEDAMEEADSVLVMTHASSHIQIASLIAPHIKDGQSVVLVPGYTGGALVFEKVFKQQGVRASYILAETNTLPYACRKIAGESAVLMKLYVEKFLVSAFPASKNEEFYSAFKQIYPNAVLTEDVLATGFNNGNPVLNVAPVVFNAGRIEHAHGEYYHFQEGVTPSVARVLEQIDEERMKVGRHYGIDVIPYLERVIETGYVKTNDTWYDMISTSPHLSAKGPNDLDHRYLTEDVPFGLVPWIALARKANIKVDLMESLVHLSSALKQENYLVAGRKLEEMGIENLSREEIKHYLQTGRME
ncbi:NAD/NADP octopine/nopaline dehydrogenase family protein [Pseudalkalibacillus caeni]|nr:NAD/NADP octopine/nopaline dehydrogenase family protein [Pseudalkalibacillus caeni]